MPHALQHAGAAIPAAGIVIDEGTQLTLGLEINPPDMNVGDKYTVELDGAPAGILDWIETEVEIEPGDVTAGVATIAFVSTPAGFTAHGGPWTIKITQTHPAPAAAAPVVATCQITVNAAAGGGGGGGGGGTPPAGGGPVVVVAPAGPAGPAGAAGAAGAPGPAGPAGPAGAPAPAPIQDWKSSTAWIVGLLLAIALVFFFMAWVWQATIGTTVNFTDAKMGQAFATETTTLYINGEVALTTDNPTEAAAFIQAAKNSGASVTTTPPGTN